MIPNENNAPVNITRALEMNPEFRIMYQQDEQVRYLIDMCKRLRVCHAIPQCTQQELSSARDQRMSLSRYLAEVMVLLQRSLQ